MEGDDKKEHAVTATLTGTLTPVEGSSEGKFEGTLTGMLTPPPPPKEDETDRSSTSWAYLAVAAIVSLGLLLGLGRWEASYLEDCVADNKWQAAKTRLVTQSGESLAKVSSLLTANQANQEKQYLAASLFEEKGGLHAAYRILITFLNLVFAIALFAGLFWIVKRGPPPLSDLVKDFPEMIKKGINGSGDGAAKAISALAVAGGVAAVPLYATYQAMPPSPPATNASPAPSSAGWQNSQLRLEQNIADLRVIKAELNASIKEEQHDNGLKDAAQKFASAAEKLEDSATRFEESAKDFKEGAGEQKNQAKEAAQATQNTAVALGMVGTYLADSATRQEKSVLAQEKLVTTLVGPLALQDAMRPLRRAILPDWGNNQLSLLCMRLDEDIETVMRSFGTSFEHTPLKPDEKKNLGEIAKAWCQLEKEKVCPNNPNQNGCQQKNPGLLQARTNTQEGGE